MAEQNDGVRLEIDVCQAWSRPVVGGEYDGRLVVRVVEPADHGRATVAAINAVADALKIAALPSHSYAGQPPAENWSRSTPEHREKRSIAELIASLRSPAELAIYPDGG